MEEIGRVERLAGRLTIAVVTTTVVIVGLIRYVASS